MPISKEMNLLRMISGGSILLWCLVVLGIGLRFYILDKKDFWMDETLTLLHVSGYNESDFRKGLITGRPIQFREVARFQKPNPEKGPAEVLSSLACSQPEHSPLFYLCAYFWARAFSAQAATMKCLPVLFSILQLPCLYWLSVELFSRRLSAELSVALMALSPLQLIYAQDLREYSLFTVAIILMTAALLRAVRNPSLPNWMLYLLCLVLGLYTSILTALIIVAHLIYLLLQDGFTRNKTLAPFFSAVLMAFVLFAPWLYVLAHNLHAACYAVEWLSTPVPTYALVQGWRDFLASIFLDVSESWPQLSNWLSIPILLLEGIAGWVIIRRGSKQATVLLTILFAVTALALLLPDLICGGLRSLTVRYMMAISVAVILAVACLLTPQGASNGKMRWFCWVGAFFFFSCELLSCAMIAQPNIRRTTSHLKENMAQVARILNEDPQAVLISENIGTNFGQVVALSHLVKPDLYFEVSPDPELPVLPPGFQHYYLFEPSPALLRSASESGYCPSPVGKLDYLFLATLPSARDKR